jgi:hypothetical protein
MPKHPPRPAVADVHEAFRSTVHDFGVPDMAAKIGVPVGTLYNKANNNESSQHKPTLTDAILVQVVSGDTRVVEAMCHTLGGLFVKVPMLDRVSDAALLEMVAEIHIQSGFFHHEVKKALADNKFTREEHRDIARQAMQFITSVLEAVKRIEGMIDE